MKKILYILFIGIIFFEKAQGDVPPIKHEKLKCLHNSHKNKVEPLKEDYLYILFEGNDVAKFVQLTPNDATYVNFDRWGVSLSLSRISLNKVLGINEWYIDRISGELSEKILGNNSKLIIYGNCKPVEANFDPEKYLQNLADKNLKKEKEKINF